jgi:hypothetical protein
LVSVPAPVFFCDVADDADADDGADSGNALDSEEEYEEEEEEEEEERVGAFEIKEGVGCDGRSCSVPSNNSYRLASGRRLLNPRATRFEGDAGERPSVLASGVRPSSSRLAATGRFFLRDSVADDILVSGLEAATGGASRKRRWMAALILHWINRYGW